MTQVLSEKSFARMIYNLTKNTVITYNGNDGEVNELLSKLSAEEMIAMLRDVVPEADLEQMRKIQNCAALIKEYQNGNRHFEYRHRLKKQEGRWFKSAFELVQIQNPYTFAEPFSVEETVHENNIQMICEKLTERAFYENDTLDISRIESRKLELHPQVCEGRDLFNTALQLMKMRMDQKKIQLTIQAENIPFTLLYVDSARIQQVVMNIIGNAVKFTPEGGAISVRMENLSFENGIITDRLTICDTGVGMSKEFLPHFFESFSQEDTTTSSTEGTGLGMAIAKQLLTLMNSEISVESEKGKGTVFTIILRLTAATDEQIAEWKRKRSLRNPATDLSGKLSASEKTKF